MTVVDQGSFSAAARVLGYTPSAVGKRVHHLEERLRVPLLIRSTRRMTLTEAGQRYVEETRELLARLTKLEADIADDADSLRGPIRVTCSAALGRIHVVPQLVLFMERHPEIEIDLALSDKLVDLVGEGYDLAIRSGTLPDSSLISRKLMTNRRLPCAAPSYLNQHGVPQQPGALAAHRCLRLPRERLVSDWGFSLRPGSPDRLGAGFSCNSLDALHAACCAGQGVAWLPEFLIREDLHAGRLQPLLADFVAPDAGGAVYFLRPEAAFQPRRIRALADFLADFFAAIEASNL